MSELKAFDVGLGQYCEDGSPCVVAFDTDRNPRLLNEKVYLKSEADKVIAELKDKLRHYPMMANLIDSGYKEIEKLKEERLWRKSSQELPEDNIIVLCIVLRIDKSYYYTLNYRRRGAWFKPDYPEYWMPLPRFEEGREL